MSSAVAASSLLLALETSCDETAVAVLRGSELLATEVASQIKEHERFGGVVPEVASRNHLVHAPRLLARAIQQANVNIQEIDAFAATTGPGLASSLMIGASIAKGLAIGLNKPYLAINHLEGHLLSPFFGQGKIAPNVSLVVSGGHTMTVLVRGVGDYRVVGRTVDDAAGEAFDKIAKLLGLGYPGGPEIEKRAVAGDPNRFDLPRSMPNSEDFSFSGLKTAVRYLLPKLTGDYLADVCASVQAAIVDVLVRKTIEAAKAHKVKLVTISGGVSCNKELRQQMAAAADRHSLELKTAEPKLCTDNAAMIGFAATLKLQNGFSSSVNEEIDPNLALVL
ncbi:MAG TPA: tRNA (adenosine(37)-N6)-threonylcarbamoyltransferase complex transferase subunit TsaD [Chthoniobacterales bacterium]|nr:tRNA (adenosine(37)-N6)-threonylcarbamoyltransferase complex transferase subunit TsaD [Chthoniobacterales bacterium]